MLILSLSLLFFNVICYCYSILILLSLLSLSSFLLHYHHYRRCCYYHSLPFLSLSLVGVSFLSLPLTIIFLWSSTFSLLFLLLLLPFLPSTPFTHSLSSFLHVSFSLFRPYFLSTFSTFFSISPLHADTS